MVMERDEFLDRVAAHMPQAPALCRAQGRLWMMSRGQCQIGIPKPCPCLGENCVGWEIEWVSFEEPRA